MKFNSIFLLIISWQFTLFAQEKNVRLASCNLEYINAIMEDGFSPPVASRLHVYSNIAAYEVLSLSNHNYNSLAGQIKHMPAVRNKNIQDVELVLAAEVAFLKTALHFIYTEDSLLHFYNNELKYWKQNLSEKKFTASINYGDDVAKKIIDWSNGDNYGITRTMHRYEIADSPGAWVPTPPEYKNGLEPNWAGMRKMVMGLDDFIHAIPNFEYSEDSNSNFYQNALAVYRAHKNLSEEQIYIANYWDDNPQTVVNKGHLMYIFKKPTPGGHWLKICTQLISELKMTELEAAELYAMVSIAMYDAFIHCWHTKYLTNSIRPCTYIQRVMGIEFDPIIETPNFPEYTSGHSCVSRSIATVLSHYISPNFAFTDSSQILLGLKPRKFISFKQASEEVSISRFYGGIHYIPALNNGLKQGEEVANNILANINTRKKFNRKVE